MQNRSQSANPLSPTAKRSLEQCDYSEEDDFGYLQSDEEWILKKFEKLRDSEKPVLECFLHQLHQTDSKTINSQYVNDFFQQLFDVEVINQMHQERRKVEIKSIFLATIVRELLLRTETVTSMEEARFTFLEKYSFLKNQEGTTTELTWLNRYERALRFLLPLMSPVGNKQYFLTTGTHLQGSDVFVEYITGGANRPETQRRVDIFEALTNVKPKPRAPKNMKKNQIKTEPEVKRGRGRPRKNPLPSPTNSISSATSEQPRSVKMEVTPPSPLLPPPAPYVMNQPTLNVSAAIEVKEDEDLYNLTDEEFIHRLMSLDEETTTDMDLVAGDDDISIRTPILYAPYHQTTQNPHNLLTVPASSSSYFNFEFMDSIYSLPSFDEDNDNNMIVHHMHHQQESTTFMNPYYLNIPTVDESDLVGKKRALSLNEIELEDEDLEMLLDIDADDEGVESCSPIHSYKLKSPTPQHKRLIALHRSRGFAKIPVHEPVPTSTIPQGEASEFPNRSIISYRFNIASVSSQDSTDMSTVESSFEPDDFDEDEIVNDIDACFEGLII